VRLRNLYPVNVKYVDPHECGIREKGGFLFIVVIDVNTN
jgi:hypothetical protein